MKLQLVYHEKSVEKSVVIPFIQSLNGNAFESSRNYRFCWEVKVFFASKLSVAIVQLDRVCECESRFEARGFSSSSKTLLDCSTQSIAIRKAIELIEEAELEELPVPEKTIEQAWEEYRNGLEKNDDLPY